MVLTEPCAAVPLLEDGPAGSPLVEPALLGRRVACPKLEAVPVLRLVEQVLVERHMVSQVLQAALAGLHLVQLVLAHWPQEVCPGSPTLRCHGC